MPIVPETKSWTWVLERTCPQCGFDAAAFDPADAEQRFRQNGAAWPAVLERADVRQRPDDSTWSPLEYGAHVRDVFGRYVIRLELARTQENPQFENWDQDATAVEERYGEQDPAVVATELVEAADAAASAVGSIQPDEWGRACRRGDGSSFTIATLTAYMTHDPVHHLWDVTGIRSDAQA